MTARLIPPIRFAGKLLLGVVGLVAGVPIVPGQNTTQSRAELQVRKPDTTSPAFEVASIKPVKSNCGFSKMAFTPDGFTATCVTVRNLIRRAYGLEDNMVVGGPGWLNSTLYDIEAKLGDSAVQELRKLRPAQRTLDNQRMLQALLADRFRLVIHHVTKDGPVYALVVAKNGPKLKDAEPHAPHPPPPDSGIQRPGVQIVRGEDASVGSIARMLEHLLGRKVLDKTGLMGHYDFELEWTQDENQVVANRAAEGSETDLNRPPQNASGPSIFTAIQEQLGLKLESQKGLVEALVIDHAEEPSPN